MKKILITGGSGALGQYLNLQLSKKFEILTLYFNNIGNCLKFKNAKVNILDYKNLIETIDGFKPEIIIHAAAVSKPLAAANSPNKFVFETNVTATENIAKICCARNIKLIYTSTDLVYAGYRSSMLKEDAKLSPASLYAETKLMGEVKIKNVFDNFIVLRTALLYGFGINHVHNFFDQMFYNLTNKKEIKLFYDQFRTPLSLPEASRIIDLICSSDLKNEVINFGGRERISRLDLGILLCEIANLDKKLITNISMNDIPDFPIVEDVSMNTDKLKSLGVVQQSVEDSIKEIINTKNIVLS